MSYTYQVIAAIIALKAGHMSIYFIFVSDWVLMSSISITCLFLSTKTYKSDSSFGNEAVLFEHFKRLKDGHNTSSIIISSCLWTCIPWIHVSPCNHYFIWSLWPHYLKHYIIWVKIILELIFHDELDSNFLTSILHSLEHLWVFNCYWSCRNFRQSRVIYKDTCMNWIYSISCLRSGKNS